MINKTGLHNDIDYVLLDQETLQRRVHELAEKLTNDYRGKNPVFLCILKGSVHFFSDLVRQFDDYCEIDFLAISSYGNARKTSGIVRINKDLDMSITGRHVIIVEDIMGFRADPESSHEHASCPRTCKPQNRCPA